MIQTFYIAKLLWNKLSNNMDILLFGASGFIGSNLFQSLIKVGHNPIVITRNIQNSQTKLNTGQNIIDWTTFGNKNYIGQINTDYGIINLSGENIAKQRWTKIQKKKILNSRVKTTNTIIKIINEAKSKPKFFIQGSAIGYYDNITGNISTEDSNKGSGYLSDLVATWEKQLENLKDQDIRTCIIRTGVVLGKEAGLFPKLKKQFKLYTGGKIGSGKQYISWIHIEDEINAILHLIENENSKGIYNLSSPNPTTNNEFGLTLAKVLNRPFWATIPSFVIKMIFGEMGIELMLKGENVYPSKLISEGFEFKFPNLESCLDNLATK